MEAYLKKQYKKQKNRSPYVFDKNGKITSNFSYTDDYVLWLETKLLNYINDEENK